MKVHCVSPSTSIGGARQHSAVRRSSSVRDHIGDGEHPGDDAGALGGRLARHVVLEQEAHPDARQEDRVEVPVDGQPRRQPVSTALAFAECVDTHLNQIGSRWIISFCLRMISANSRSSASVSICGSTSRLCSRSQ